MAAFESQCKYLLNSLDTNIRDHLTGLARTDPSLQIVPNVDAIVRKDVAQLKGRVLLVSGGGAGHEPMFAGFVGTKQLTAAVSGSYFASPSAGAIMRLVEQIAGPDSSILFIQANYTGDRLNFGLAIEYLRLHGYKNLGSFVFGDDLAPFVTGGLCGEDYQIKRRGLAGIIFVHRIAGVLSERGQSLSQILDYLQRISRLIYTFSVSLSAADIVGHGASFRLPDDQMELGLGVHGESGVRRSRLLSTRETVSLMLDELIGHLDGDGILERYQRRIVVLVNNLGGLIPMEMNIIVNEVIEQLQGQRNVNIERFYSGSLFTSFNMKASNELQNHGRLFRDICSSETYGKCLKNACQAIIDNENFLNRLDETVGDSDCGSTLASIARLILDQFNLNLLPPTFGTISQLLINGQIGGTSGAIYSILFTAAHHFVHQIDDDFDENQTISPLQRTAETFWLRLLEYCLQRISTYGGARINDRSMIDGLYGIIVGLKQCIDDDDDDDHDRDQYDNEQQLATSIIIVAESTWHQAKKTASMQAKVGRASYVNQSLVIQPDAGAIAVAIWLQAIIDTLTYESSGHHRIDEQLKKINQSINQSVNN
ncbi:hypothetical protein HUG17_8678 [Dermatophagoides farinae]|uniref:Triokinase/FMN cyclase n=1 Tax=Dermatophagoides farinae TaxID=6954 RepID=A0A9D4NSA4_DERFA|nr:hypothetical protein HUG17_8678 [Dermatophagoides farinae]